MYATLCNAAKKQPIGASSTSTAQKISTAQKHRPRQNNGPTKTLTVLNIQLRQNIDYA